MTKKFTINCNFGGQVSPFAIYIGQPEAGHHPLHFQADWLSKARGGTIPGEVMEAISNLQKLSAENGASLEDLCVYALGNQQVAVDGASETQQEEQHESEADHEAIHDEDIFNT